jgi:carbamoyl-phosphate synthase large subunit
MSIGRTFKESFLKGVRSLELGKQGLLLTQAGEEEDDAALRKKLVVPNDRRMWALFKALERGWSVEQLHELTHIDPWFLQQFGQIAELRRIAGMQEFRELSADFLRTLKRGFGMEKRRITAW